MVNNLINQLAKFSNSTASNLIIERIELLNEEIQKLKNELKLIQYESNKAINSNLNLDKLIDNLNRFNSEIDKANLDQKKQLLSSILSYIEWSSDDNTIIINYIGFNKNVNSINPTDKINSKLHFRTDSRSNIYVR